MQIIYEWSAFLPFTSFRKVIDGETEKETDNVNPKKDVSETAEEEIRPEESEVEIQHTKQDLLKESRKFNIDLAPKASTSSYETELRKILINGILVAFC